MNPSHPESPRNADLANWSQACKRLEHGEEVCLHVCRLDWKPKGSPGHIDRLCVTAPRCRFEFRQKRLDKGVQPAVVNFTHCCFPIGYVTSSTGHEEKRSALRKSRCLCAHALQSVDVRRPRIFPTSFLGNLMIHLIRARNRVVDGREGSKYPRFSRFMMRGSKTGLSR